MKSDNSNENKNTVNGNDNIAVAGDENTLSVVEQEINQQNNDLSNRVGETGLVPVSTSHTTVRTDRYTAVL